VRLGLLEDKKSIGVDQIREFTRLLYLTSERGRGRIAVIDPADAMNWNAANALLKTIEEPPAGARLVLIAERLRALPPTIRSRCQLLRFSAPQRRAAEDWLKSRKPDAIAELPFAGGAPLRAVEMGERELAAKRDQWQRDLMGLSKGAASPLAVADSWQRHDEHVALLEWLQNLLSQMLRARLGGEGVPQPLAAIGQRLSMHALATLAREAARSRQLLAQSQASPLLVLENLTVSWYQLCHTGSDGEAARRR
jgi:DNA polymerase-3 subunit delta'